MDKIHVLDALDFFHGAETKKIVIVDKERKRKEERNV
jgi:hypothetical protein